MTGLSREEKTELMQSVSVLKLTLPKMSDLDIPTTPENYSVWYEYSMGIKRDLIKAIDDLHNEGSTFTRKVNQQLYRTYIADGTNNTLEKVQVETKALVVSLMNKLDGMHKGSEKFSGSLNNFQKILKTEPDITTFTKLLETLIDETEEIQQVNAQMVETLELVNKEVESLTSDMNSLNAVALTDQLTSVHNRRAFDEEIDFLFSEYEEDSRYFSLLLLDIDHFKKFNDTHGHAIGDKVLKYVAATLKSGIKGEDFVARYGGEEFVILLPDTDYKGAMAVADYVRTKVCEKRLTTGTEFKKTIGKVEVSVGVATVTKEDEPSSIMERADQAMYQAKETGRNRVVGERELM